MATMVSSKTRRIVLAGGGAGFAVVLIGLFVWWNRPPQMGADDEAFKSVDALFTAVTARDEKLLGRCEQQLHACRDVGKLPEAAATHLDGVIRQAKAGRWDSAAERLYDFMRAQRRDGPAEASQKKQSDSRPRK